MAAACRLDSGRALEFSGRSVLSPPGKTARSRRGRHHALQFAAKLQREASTWAVGP